MRLVTSTGAGEWRDEATLAVVAVGWVAATSGMDLDAAGVQDDQRCYIQVDDELRTSAHHVFAAGDVTGRAMLVREAVRGGGIQFRLLLPVWISTPATHSSDSGDEDGGVSRHA